MIMRHQKAIEVSIHIETGSKNFGWLNEATWYSVVMHHMQTGSKNFRWLSEATWYNVGMHENTKCDTAGKGESMMRD